MVTKTSLRECRVSSLALRMLTYPVTFWTRPRSSKFLTKVEEDEWFSWSNLFPEECGKMGCSSFPLAPPLSRIPDNARIFNRDEARWDRCNGMNLRSLFRRRCLEW